MYYRTPGPLTYLLRMPDAVVLEWEGMLADAASVRHDALLRALSKEDVCRNAEVYAMQCDGRPLMERQP